MGIRVRDMHFLSCERVIQDHVITGLEIKYESTFDLAEVETYAKSALGMVKAGADQTTFVRSTEGDKAQILGKQGFLANWERKLDGFARRIQAYFR